MDGTEYLIHRLHETLGKMELALGSISEAMVWTDNQGTIAWCNKSFDTLVAKPHINILGKKLQDILHLKHSGSEVKGKEYPLQALIHDPISPTSTYEIERAGEQIVLEISGNKISVNQSENLFILTLRDVTDLTRSQKELQKAKANLERRVQKRTDQLLEVKNKYKNILFEAVDAIITINQDGLIQSFNPAAERIFGYSSAEVIDKNITLLMPAPHRENHSQYIRNYLQTGNRKVIGLGREVTGIRRDGSPVPLYLGVSEIKSKNQIVFTGMLRDISLQKQTEHNLQQAKEQAESANRAKSAFLANMSHEIRTPMNAVLGFSELLASLITDTTQKSYIDAIHTAGKGLLTIINDILDLSKIEAGRLDIHYQPADIRHLFAEIQQIFKPALASKNIAFFVDLAPTIPARLVIDEIRLRQILINLVGNAVKFTHTGFVRLSAEVDINDDAKECDMTISVEDSGQGIPLSNQEIIFHAFQQLDNESNQQHRIHGTGLGLAITRRLVEMMQGKISLESRLDKGSKFKVFFPAIKAPSTVHVSSRKRRRFDITSLAFEPASILIVDDVDSNRQLIKAILSRTALAVWEAQDGEKALDIIRKRKPALVLLDIRMPEMDGFAVIRQIKNDVSISHIPVVAFTASGDVGEKAQFDDAGFDGMLLKPTSAENLAVELCRFLPFSPTTDPAKQKKSSETASNDQPLVRSQEFLQRLENECLNNWQQFHGAFELEKVLEFAEQLHRLAVTHNAKELIDYAETLQEAVKQFKIDTIKQSMEHFPTIIERMKKEINSKS